MSDPSIYGIMVERALFYWVIQLSSIVHVSIITVSPINFDAIYVRSFNIYGIMVERALLYWVIQLSSLAHITILKVSPINDFD